LVSEVPSHREIIQLTDEETERFEAQLKRGPGPAARRTASRLLKARATSERSKEAVA
jgi:hypothetical protein